MLRAMEWSQEASAVNATATATKAAASGKRHYVARVVASFSAAPAAPVLLTITCGTQTVTHYVSGAGPATIDLTEHGLGGALEGAVSAALAAGGAAVTGRVTIVGYSEG